jgi:hypothetical protein
MPCAAFSISPTYSASFPIARVVIRESLSLPKRIHNPFLPLLLLPTPTPTMSEQTSDTSNLFTCLSCSIAFYSAEDQRTSKFSVAASSFI